MCTWTLIDTQTKQVWDSGMQEWFDQDVSYMERSPCLYDFNDDEVGCLYRIRDASTNKITSITFVPTHNFEASKGL